MFKPTKNLHKPGTSHFMSTGSHGSTKKPKQKVQTKLVEKPKQKDQTKLVATPKQKMTQLIAKPGQMKSLIPPNFKQKKTGLTCKDDIGARLKKCIG